MILYVRLLWPFVRRVMMRALPQGDQPERRDPLTMGPEFDNALGSSARPGI